MQSIIRPTCKSGVAVLSKKSTKQRNVFSSRKLSERYEPYAMLFLTLIYYFQQNQSRYISYLVFFCALSNILTCYVSEYSLGQKIISTYINPLIFTVCLTILLSIFTLVEQNIPCIFTKCNSNIFQELLAPQIVSPFQIYIKWFPFLSESVQ